MNVLIATYSHPELYPPVLSAVEVISKRVKTINIVTRQNEERKWNYPDNIKLINTTLFKGGYELEKENSIRKILRFINFTYQLYIKINKQTKLIIVYDPIPLMSLYLILPFFRKKYRTLWYHNHDRVNKKTTPKFSILGIAGFIEKIAINKVNYFSVPSKERFEYYDIEKIHCHKLIIPNFPLKKHWVNKDSNILRNTLKILFQGSVGKGHGIEEIIEFVARDYKNIYKFNIIGKIREAFKNKIINLINTNGLHNKVKYFSPVTYTELKNTTKEHHVGLAVYVEKDENWKSMSTASNKIFEYISCGLPVLFYDSPHFREYFEKYDWAFFTDLSEESLATIFTEIRDNYFDLSKSARKSFIEEFNYEEKSGKIINRILAEINY